MDWILCKDGMPKERQTEFAGNGKKMPRSWSRDTYVTIQKKGEPDKPPLMIKAHTVDGEWVSSYPRILKDAEVVAWWPMPSRPYGSSLVRN